MNHRDTLIVAIEGLKFVAAPKQFKSGRRGYYAGGKIAIDGKPYWINLNIVEARSKPKARIRLFYWYKKWVAGM